MAFKVKVTYGDVHIRDWYAEWIKKYAKETLGMDVSVKIVPKEETEEVKEAT
ncbi:MULTISPECIES: hypothetical protein [Brevibacillus]|uniref:Uncharacterized protein n=1 Tax=Brevibacillus fulvus TaxID=1125967 RepID=A0A938XVH6_9BACL|nr:MULTISPECIES: hypothetical protein [Brevibacillus]EJL40781.1 hypothetical protein PMI08_04248 [Brevibacillus sp. CF112]MBM7591233.1 hypothetical protein [Brevibacillus fulvus]